MIRLPPKWPAVAWISLWMAAGHASGAFAQSASSEVRHFEIPAGDAARRLNDFYRQSGMEGGFDFGAIKGLQVNAVYGDYKPFEALDLMLKGTGIRYELVNGSVNFSRQPVLAPSREEPSTVADIRRSQARVPARDRRTASGDLEVVTIRAAQPEAQGSAVGAPYYSLSRKDIDALGYVTVPQVVRTLPQVFGGGPTEDTRNVGFEASTNLGWGSGINLRGLSAGSTLVLINGKRRAGSGSHGAFVDVSNLPVSAVERMDILPDSSSTLYGADAVGGVVNFVMRDSFDGMETEAFYGVPTQGAAETAYVSQIAGVRGERTKGLVAFDFYLRSSLPAASRSLSTSNLTAFGGSNFDVMQTNPGNILVGPFTWAIPRGQDGTALTPSDLVPGTRNLADRYEGTDLLPSQQRWSLFGSGESQLTDRLSYFADVLLTQRDVRAQGAGYPGTFQVPSTHPYYVNPTGLPLPVTVVYNFGADLGPMQSESRVTSVSAAAGVDYIGASGWQSTASLSYASELLENTIRNVVSEAVLYRALNDVDPVRVFNPFGDGSSTHPEVLESLRGSAAVQARSSVSSFALVSGGPLNELPGGSLRLSLGTEGRIQTFESRNYSSELATAGSFLRPRVVYSGFGDLRMPVVGDQNRMRGVNSLVVSVAGRFERYDDIGDEWVMYQGLEWEPWAGVTLRGSYSDSFRPPGLLDLDESANVYAVLPMQDPANGGVSAVLIWAGRNRDLRAETARTWTAGLSLQPAFSPATAIAMTYFDTRFRNRLVQPQLAADILLNPVYGNLVTRDVSADYRRDVCSRAPQGGGAGNCLTTPIAAIVDIRSRNDAIVVTRGFDLVARYSRDTPRGRFGLRLNGTYILEFSEAKTPLLPLVDRVSTPNYPINLTARVSGSYERGPFMASMYVNYQNSYLDTVSSPRRHVGSWTTVNAHMSYTLSGEGFVGDTVFSLGLDNLADVSPPFVNNAVGIGYDQENGDLIGRVVSVSVRKKW